MNLSSNHTKLFNEVGCLSEHAIQLYIDKSLDKGDLDLIKKHTNSCSICKDAISGAIYFSSKKVFARNLSSIRSNYFKHKNDRQILQSRWLSINTTILFSSIILLVGIYIILQAKKNNINPFKQEKQTSSEAIPDTLIAIPDSTKHFIH